MKQRLLIVLVATVVWASACDDSEDFQPNPSFTAGTTSNAGAPATSEGGDGNLPAAGGSPDVGNAGSGTNPGSGGAGQAGAGRAGEAGAPVVQPPYDCVLEPKTHLEIINACTDAVRIEKHPELPAIP